jgi:hypothetical protein
MVRNTEKCGKSDTRTVGHEIWRETMKKVENETHTLKDLEYGKEH